MPKISLHYDEIFPYTYIELDDLPDEQTGEVWEVDEEWFEHYESVRKEFQRLQEEMDSATRWCRDLSSGKHFPYLYVRRRGSTSALPVPMFSLVPAVAATLADREAGE